MLKKLLVTIAIGFSSTSMAFEWPEVPSLKDQFELAEIEVVVDYFEKEPYFAGKTVNIEMHGRTVVVDRTKEPNTTPPGTPPPSGSAMIPVTDILNGLQAGAKGNVGINVERKWTDNGVLIYEKWGIVVGGEYKIEKQPLSNPKNEKTTGEEKQ